jgi:UDP-N-acetyl-D-glucosamine/UDP-N-acetyl-D-galactosamine dehydrogenase
MLGITFKENCPDVRNTKIVDVVAALADYGILVSIYDPWANPTEVKHEYGLTCLSELVEGQKFDALVLGVAHKEFLSFPLANLRDTNSVLYDVKGILGVNVDGKL